MKTSKIASNQLPEIDPSVMECVNAGQWLLFRSGNSKYKAAYFLKVGSNIFALDERGGILKELKDSSSAVGIDELLYFSDLPRPVSLSNLAV